MDTPTLAPAAPGARAEQALGQIAVALPGATAVFRRHKLDFCCGGQISLRDAAAQRGLDLEALLGELAGLDRDDRDGEVPREPAALIDHILARYHEVHRAQLPELIRMARRVEAVHRDHPDVPAGLADHLEAMHDELLEHMAKEEEVLFPMLRRGGHPFVSQPIAVMRDEHLHHGDSLARLAALTHDANPPVGACTTWRALYAGIGSLTDDLMQHIHLENNLLFPAFEPTPVAANDGDCGGACACASK